MHFDNIYITFHDFSIIICVIRHYHQRNGSFSTLKSFKTASLSYQHKKTLYATIFRKFAMQCLCCLMGDIHSDKNSRIVDYSGTAWGAPRRCKSHTGRCNFDPWSELSACTKVFQKGKVVATI